MKIIFLARIAGPFTGQTVLEGNLGGSESAVVYMARELAGCGHEVTVTSKCPDSAGVYDGVTYKNFTTLKNFAEFTRENDFDILVALRDVEIFFYPVKARVKIWMGPDDFSPLYQKPFPLNYLGGVVFRILAAVMKKKVDCFFMVSQWQKKMAQKYTKLPDEKFFVAKNGVNLPYFEKAGIPREKFRLIYTSVPERGLDVLLDIFPLIKKEIPEAELYVFCCFDYWRRKDWEDSKIFGRLYEKAQKTAGVFLKGCVKQTELAEELLHSRVFVYPSHAAPKFDFFAETFCVAALEAQAAGTPVVASARGALTETVVDGQTGVLIPGDPYSTEFQKRFAEETIKLLKDEERWQKMSLAARKWSQTNFPWPNIARQWGEKFTEFLDKKEGNLRS